MLILVLLIVFANDDCFIALDSIVNESTRKYIEYTENLLDSGDINNKDLDNLLTAMSNDSFSINPISEESTWYDPLRMIHYETFERFKNQDLNTNKIKQFLIQRLNKNEVLIETKEKTVTTTNTVAPDGDFSLATNERKIFDINDNSGNTYTIELTHPFEVSSSLITGKMWNSVFKESHYYHPTSGHNENARVEVSWLSALYYADALSKKNGFRPVYDLENIFAEMIDFSSISPVFLENLYLDFENGQIDTDAVNSILKKMAPDYYNQEGYRLPTEAELLYIKTNSFFSNPSWWERLYNPMNITDFQEMIKFQKEINLTSSLLSDLKLDLGSRITPSPSPRFRPISLPSPKITTDTTSAPLGNPAQSLAFRNLKIKNLDTYNVEKYLENENLHSDNTFALNGKLLVDPVGYNYSEWVFDAYREKIPYQVDQINQNPITYLTDMVDGVIRYQYGLYRDSSIALAEYNRDSQKEFGSKLDLTLTIDKGYFRLVRTIKKY